MTNMTLGIIGGSGLYDLPGMENIRRETVKTPWGDPSDPLVFGTVNGLSMVFLPRHGDGHHTPPSQVNYRANIDALKRSGATDIIGLSACGSLRENLVPGEFVILDQFIDRTSGRDDSFFGPGFVGHVSMADPVSRRLGDWIEQACKQQKIPHHRGGTYLAMNGPQFSSRAESELYRTWGADVIGMTNMPEANLAREAELPYASIAMITDYDCWRPNTDDVQAVDVLAVMKDNVHKAQKLLMQMPSVVESPRTPDPQGIDTTLDLAVVTRPDRRDPEMIRRLDAVAGRFLAAEGESNA